MLQVLNSGNHKARKEHTCNYCGFKIQKDEIYHRSTCVYDYIYVWKSHTKCYKIAAELNMYDECDEGLTGDAFCEFIKEEYINLQIKINNESFESKDFNYPDFKGQLDFVCNYYLNNGK